MDRYRAQIQLPEIGPSGQEKLRESRVLIVGCGGLGSIAAPYLIGAGVGEVVLMDRDVAAESNLHRQVIYGGQLGKNKAEVLAEYGQKLNPEVVSKAYPEYFTSKHASLIDQVDVVLDCTDSVPTKLLLEDMCKRRNTVLIAASVERFEGFLAVITPNFKGYALPQIYEQTQSIEACSEVGILGPVVGMLGLQQALTCLKLLTGLEVKTDGFTWYNFKTDEQYFITFAKTTASHTASRLVVEEVDLAELNTSHVLVSILEDYEHEEIREGVIRYPLDSLNINELDANKEYVFYCANGKRSWALVDHILKRRPGLQVKSLRGGLQRYSVINNE